jgi:hypothetical protein
MNMYLYLPPLSVGDDEVVNDALVGNLHGKRQRIPKIGLEKEGFE